ncbi:MAG TPA: hypothetical protein VLV54_17535, partial [Thermoanaerobaculia bacterium]|nr:hypothetical protein [Thermoanaerobaculia bacterium]
MGTSSRHKIYLVRTTSSPHCHSRSVLLQNVEPDLHRKPRPDTWAIVTALFFAVSVFGFLGVYLLYRARVAYSPDVYYQHVTISMLGVGTVLAVLLFGALVFIVVYPLMGLTVTYTFRALVTEIVQIYG